MAIQDIVPGLTVLTDTETSYPSAFADGVTDSKVAIDAALNAASTSLFVPDGTYYSSTLGATSITKTIWGTGQLETSDGNKRGKIFVNVTSAPTTGTHSSITTAFNGTFKTPQVVEHRITGSTTLGQPSSGYLYRPEAAAYYGVTFCSGGFNNSTSGNSGRTGATHFRVKVDNYGQGDLVAYNFTGFVSGAKAGATSFLANPAVVGFNGDLTAGANGCYLNPYEVSASDNGYDLACVGHVNNFNRTNDTGALGVFWAGYASQSTGTKSINAHFYGNGKAVIGLDLTGTTFESDKAAICFKADDRIYFSCTNADSTKYPRYTTVGTDYITYNSSGSAMTVIVGGTQQLALGTGTGAAAKATIRRLNISNIPTASAGLNSGDVWSDSGTLKIVT